MSDRCRSCQAPIVWAVTANEKRMPVDAEPVPDGNLILTSDDPPRVIMHVLGQASLFDEPDPPRYVSHFATCPHADRHRRKDDHA